MALRARKVLGSFEKRAPGSKFGPLDPEASLLTIKPPRLSFKFNDVYAYNYYDSPSLGLCSVSSFYPRDASLRKILPDIRSQL